LPTSITLAITSSPAPENSWSASRRRSRSATASTPRTRAATSPSTIAPRRISRPPICWRSTRPPRCGGRTVSRCSTRI
jgi:hypothetical protein